MAEIGDTAEQVLDVAQRLLQTRGYNGFSYKDIAQALGIRTASIHYHFPTKADLGVELAGRHRRQFRAALDRVEQRTTDPIQRLERFVDLFRQTFEVESRLCLCGMLSAEIATLPEPVAGAVEGFFSDAEEWLADTLAAGRKAGRLRFTGSPRQQARLLLAVLEGAMVVARGMRHTEHFQDVVAGHLRGLLSPQSSIKH
ncbi:MAG: TetR/AcrR family transcriptional regulator [Nitrospirae bacterium]|nr:TetR/AcrR family transcriptional regulator [Nitrospirota bacterium]